MREPRGAWARTVGAAVESLAGAARRRQVEREPRAIVYDADGHSRLVAAGTPEHERLVETARAMVALADEATGRAAGGPDPDDDPLAEAADQSRARRAADGEQQAEDAGA